MNIDKRFNGVDLVNNDNIYILPAIKEPEVQKSKRININYALREDIEKLWRFTEKNNKFISVKIR